MLLIDLVSLHEVIPSILDVHLSRYAIFGVALLQTLQFHPSPFFKFLFLCYPYAYIFYLIQVALSGQLQSLQLAELALQGTL